MLHPGPSPNVNDGNADPRMEGTWCPTTPRTGTVQRPLDEAIAATWRVVTEKGYSDLETSDPTVLMFGKRSGVLPVGKDVTVQFEALSPTTTRLNVTAATEATFDYGRSRRATHGVLDAVGADSTRPAERWRRERG